VHAGDAERDLHVVLLQQADDGLAATRGTAAQRRGRLGPNWRGFGHAGSV
jgi:hypothetical protein